MSRQVYCKDAVVQAVSTAAANALVERDNNGDSHFATSYGDSAVVSLGGFGTGLVSKTANFTADDDNGTITFDCTSGAATLTLPDATSFTATTGFPIFEIKRYDATPATDTSYFVDIDGNGSQTIDGDTHQYLTVHGESIRIQSDGSNWKILSRYVPKRTVTKAAAFNVAAEGTVYLATMGSAYTITFPPAASWKDKSVWIKKVDAAAFGAIADGNASEDIEGADTLTLSATQFSCAEFTSDGTAWHVISNK